MHKQHSNLHRINTHFIWFFQLPQMRPKSNTRVETDDRLILTSLLNYTKSQTHYINDNTIRPRPRATTAC